MDSLIVGSNRKIDPSRRSHLLADGTPNDNDRVEIGPTQLAYDEWKAAGLVLPDLPALREYRLERLQQQIQAQAPLRPCPWQMRSSSCRERLMCACGSW